MVMGTTGAGPSLGDQFWIELENAYKNREEFNKNLTERLQEKENIINIIVNKKRYAGVPNQIEHKTIRSMISRDYDISFEFRDWKCNAKIEDYTPKYSKTNFKLESFSVERKDESSETPLGKNLVKGAHSILGGLESKHCESINGPWLIVSDNPEFIQFTGDLKFHYNKKVEFLLTPDKFTLNGWYTEMFYNEWIELIDILGHGIIYSNF